LYDANELHIIWAKFNNPLFILIGGEKIEREGERIILKLLKNMLKGVKTFGKEKKIQLKLSESAKIIPRSQHCISRADISENALRVLYRLKKAHFAAVLVGGSVRDLLMRHTPKDFDIATNATPPEIRKLFRNCRLVGRRFRLAHIHFGKEIIEVATFRGHPDDPESPHLKTSPDGLILSDNTYGSIEEDVMRRDFTVNALYYNIEDFSIVDYVDGFSDLQKKSLRLIGDPEKRYREDPVRLLRAIRFAAKLGFTIASQTEAPIFKMGNQLHVISPERLAEEINKLFFSGFAVRSYEMLTHYALWQHLFPAADKSLNINDETLSQQRKNFMLSVMQNTDFRIKDEKPVMPAFLLSAILWFPLRDQIEIMKKQGMTPLLALEQAMGIVLNQQRTIIAIPKRLMMIIREIWILQYRFSRRAGLRSYRLLAHPRFRAAYDFLLIRSQSQDASTTLADWWKKFQYVSHEERNNMVKKIEKESKKKISSQ